MSTSKKTTTKKQVPVEPLPFSGSKSHEFYFERGILCVDEDPPFLNKEQYDYRGPWSLANVCEDSTVMWPEKQEFLIMCLDGNKNMIAQGLISNGKAIDIAHAVRVASFSYASSIVIYTVKHDLFSKSFPVSAFESKLINVLNDALKWINCKVEDFIIFGGGNFALKGHRPLFSFREEGLMPDEPLPIL